MHIKDVIEKVTIVQACLIKKRYECMMRRCVGQLQPVTMLQRSLFNTQPNTMTKAINLP